MLNVRNFPLISDQIEYPELAVIVRELERVLKNQIAGSVVELGCYTGTTSLFIQRVIQQEALGRSFHVYDSFEGLPQKTAQDLSPAGIQFQAGELSTSKQTFIKHFKHAGLPLPYIHKAWFEELTSDDIPDSVAFAFLDGDFFTSISSSLAILSPVLAAGACVIVDDYQSEALPGARRAVDEWARNNKFSVRTEQSLAIIHI